MPKWIRWLIVALAALLSLSVLYIVFYFIFLDFFVNLWWFDAKGYQWYYLMRLFYRYVIFSVILLLFFLIFFLNFWIASRYLGHWTEECEPSQGEKLQKYQKLLHMIQTGSLRIYTPLSLLLAIPIAIPFYEQWQDGLLYLFGPNAGIEDPFYGKDISYYLFSLPIYLFLQSRLFIASVLLFLALIFLYYFERRLLCRGSEDADLPKGARIHLSIVAAVVILTQAWGFYLQTDTLLYTENNLPIFFGPGFIEIYIQLPLIIITMIAFLGMGFTAIYYAHRRRGIRVLIVFAVIFVIGMAFRSTNLPYESIDKFVVKPNEAEYQKPFIENSIEATLDAFKMVEVDTRDYDIARNPQFITDPDVQATLHNVPVWDRELLDDVYTQIQGFRPYYTFPNVDVGRYTVQGLYQQVNLAARELDISQLPESARNWINSHLQYTHGFGAVMTPAAQGGEEPMVWFIRDIPLESVPGFDIKRPGIYYGLGKYTYVIAPNDIGEIDHPQDNINILTNYSGRGGVPIPSFWKKMLFAVYFKDRNIFFTTKTNDKSQILFRQNIVEAINTITPFFLLDNDPYLVTTNEGLFWIQDAYTVSDLYPYAQRYSRKIIEKRELGSITSFNKEFGDLEFNYIRNSVKIIVDAYNGTIDYYIADPLDPIVRAYQRIYPGLLKPLEEMPAPLRKHIRYPNQYFSVQMSIYAKYHQTNPYLFYQEEDNWEFAKTSYGIMKPYYLTLNLLNPDKQEFILVSPMSPVGRDNLRALAIVGCDPPNYGKVVIYSFPKGEQIYGPSQISALINQDTFIAQEMTLWDQAGSEVRFGRMIVLPVGKSVLYIQPIYLRSAMRLKIPELKRIIVSQGDMVVMARSLEEALRNLEERLSERSERIRDRINIPGLQQELPAVEPPPPPEGGS